jgi:acyl-CoA thioester hydrolase
MGHVYYANYLTWFEIGRTELLRQSGQTYCEWEEKHGVFLPVTKCWIDYRRSAQYDEVVLIRTRVAELTRASITFHYEILHRERGDVLAEGGTRHAFVNADGKVVRAADRLLPGWLTTSPAKPN